MRGFFSFLLVCAFTSFQAQSNLSNSIKLHLSEGKMLTSGNFLVKGSAKMIDLYARNGALTKNYSVGDIHNVTCSYQTIYALALEKEIQFIDHPAGKKRTLADTMLVRNRVQEVKTGQFPLSQAYDGSGVLIGFIDTGLDFNHPDFKDTAGNTRIRYLWDQKPTSGSSVPSPFNYGIEWTDTQINSNQCTHNDLSNFGHGTHVAGVGAGNGNGNGTHTGVASGADIIAVAVDFNKQGPTTLDAVQYIISKAAQLGKPCVINASIGDYYGSHDATDLEALAIESLITNQPGVIMVAAAGNAGSVKYHVKTQPAGDTTFTWLKKNSTSLDYWTYADTAQIKNIEFAIGANRANYSDAGRISFFNYSYGLQSLQTDTLFNASHQRLGLIKTSASINNMGVYELYINIAADTNNLFWRIESKGIGLHNAWNFDFVSTALPASTLYPFISKYSKPDSLLSMVSGFQCSDEVVTVANYNNKRFHFDVNNVLQDNGLVPGEINGGSSLGPTRDGRQKPDIAATGQMVFSAIPLSMLPNLIANAPHVVAQGSLHVRGGGTSVASPVVAGIAALYLQKYPAATNRDFKKAVIDCAYLDQYTGTAIPDYQWGHGKIDAKATLLCNQNIVGIRSTSMQAAEFFPNPFQQSITLTFPHDLPSAELTAYAADGRTICRKTISGSLATIDGSEFGNYKGLILLKIGDENFTTTIKVVKE